MQEGLVQRTSRGRMLTERGYRHIGLVPLRPPAAAQLDLLGDGEAQAV
jgi:Holliday junction DNA helicase RuvB